MAVRRGFIVLVMFLHIVSTLPHVGKKENLCIMPSAGAIFCFAWKIKFNWASSRANTRECMKTAKIGLELRSEF